MIKQVLQSYRTGELTLAEVPPPGAQPGHVLVATRCSAISAGTEAQMRRLAQSSLLSKARARPDLVRRVIQKAKTEGLLATAQQVRARLDQPITMGYSTAGEVIAVGEGVDQFHPGQRVACAGVGYATHSEVNVVPVNLVTPIPDNVSDENAAFIAIGAIAMQGVRQAQVQLGEIVAVVGLGLVGQVTVQLLRAAGCKVIGADPDTQRQAEARHLGAEAVPPDQLTALAAHRSEGRGADAVIVTASSDSNQIMIQCAEVARLRGRIVIVGFVGMDFPQKLFYEKELDIRFSMSYGPGRYDPSYEEHGHDYPYSLVRWTEGRNMQAVLELVRDGRLSFTQLVTHRFPIDQVLDAYALLDGGNEPYLGITLTYPRDVKELTAPPPASSSTASTRVDRIGIGVLGAGNYARGTLLPALVHHETARLEVLATATGKTARDAAQQFGFARHHCEPAKVFDDAQVDAVFITTRHHQHATQVIAALEAGKHVFVEKPLALSESELEAIQNVYAPRQTQQMLLVGHNRRFSSPLTKLRGFFEHRHTPMQLHYRVNVGPMEPDHWHRGPEGGGRWLGEGSHFVDFAVALVGALPVRVQAMRTRTSSQHERGESWSVTLELADGSVASITYCDLGDRSLPKERCEVFADGKAAVLDDFSRLTLYASGRRRTMRLAHDKGHAAEVERFLQAVQRGGEVVVPWAEQWAVARATVLADAARREGRSMPVQSAPVSSNGAVTEPAFTESAGGEHA